MHSFCGGRSVGDGDLDRGAGVGQLRALSERHTFQVAADSLDSQDQQIISLLRGDPRRSNKLIANAVGLSEQAVAGRIRSLTSRNVIRIAPQRDVFSLGYDLIAMLRIHVHGRDVGAVCEDLKGVDEVASISLMLGAPQISGLVHARDRDHLQALLLGPLALIPGIAKIETDVMLSVLKYNAEIGILRP